MDVYSLTRKKRPSHLTVAQPSSSTRVTSDNDSALEVSIGRPNDEVTESPTRNHWKVYIKVFSKKRFVKRSSTFI
jgi:hypothetical protein